MNDSNILDIKLKNGHIKLKKIVRIRKEKIKKIDTHVYLPEYQFLWLKAQKKSMSEIIENAIEKTYKIPKKYRKLKK